MSFSFISRVNKSSSVSSPLTSLLSRLGPSDDWQPLDSPSSHSLFYFLTPLTPSTAPPGPSMPMLAPHPSLHPLCPLGCLCPRSHLTHRSIHHVHLHLHPSPCVVIRHRSLAILVHGHIHLVAFRSICLVTFRSTPHARMRARSCAHLPMGKDPDTPHAHVPLPSLKRVQSSTQRADTARQGGGGACYPPTRAHCQTDTLAPKTYM